MALYLLRRLGFILLTILVVSIIIFAVTQLLPGDVAQVMLGQFATDQAVDNLREELGLNRPAYVQYLDWLANFVRGDWGNSLVSQQPVRADGDGAAAEFVPCWRLCRCCSTCPWASCSA